MQKIEFYFDPSCPWCWITSRWLVQVQQERALEVSWKPFSLAIKNDELSGGSDSAYAAMHTAAHKVLRVIEKTVADCGSDRGDLYTAFGKAHFVDGSAYSDELIAAVLKEQGVDGACAAAADDASADAQLQVHLDDALAVVGADVGVPTIIFENGVGDKTGFFGPVLTELPTPEESVKLWDGLAALSSNKNFYELKRTRTVGPDVASTSKLFPR